MNTFTQQYINQKLQEARQQQTTIKAVQPQETTDIIPVETFKVLRKERKYLRRLCNLKDHIRALCSSDPTIIGVVKYRYLHKGISVQLLSTVPAEITSLLDEPDNFPLLSNQVWRNWDKQTKVFSWFVGEKLVLRSQRQFYAGYKGLDWLRLSATDYDRIERMLMKFEETPIPLTSASNYSEFFAG